MKKVISYSLFGDPKSFEFPFYLRGAFLNARMNLLLYPGWETWLSVHPSIFDKYENYLMKLPLEEILTLDRGPLCHEMLFRMYPIFIPEVSHVICRDLDAITTYREAQAVQEWVDSGLGFHGITDNPAHTLPMMGGLVGFKVDHFKQTFPEYDTFEKLVANFDLSKHGSDQQLLMKRIYPKAKGDMMGHFFEGCTEQVRIKHHSNGYPLLPGVDPKLWESNLTCRHIGSPGVVDMEVLRFFQRFDKTDYSSFENEFKDICYWRQ